MIPDHVKQVPGKRHVITKPKPKIITQENQLIQITGPIKNQVNHLQKKETDSLVIDSLQHDITIDFLENYPHQ